MLPSPKCGLNPDNFDNFPKSYMLVNLGLICHSFILNDRQQNYISLFTWFVINLKHPFYGQNGINI